MASGLGEWTFVFTDIVDSTPLSLALGEEYFELLEIHQRILRAAWSAHGGHEVKTEGDSFFVAFEDPSAAIAACLDAQLGLAAHPWSPGKALRARMGVHTGPARQVGSDYLGPGVNEAARVSDAAHGGQVVATDAALANATLPDGVTARDLGRHGLKGIAEARVIYQVEHPDLPQVFPPLRTLTAVRHSLPVPPSPLIGRAEQLATVERLALEHAQLVTLVGTGGIGKTRLALEIGWELLAFFPGGVYLIEAAALSRPEDVVRAIAAALEVQLLPERSSIEQIAEVVRVRTLLILDNLEHLLDVADPVGDLLAASSQVQVIATSRERLRLRAEQVVRIEPLDLPDAAVTALADLEASDAGAMFLERLSARDRGARWTDAEAPAVAAITRALEGVPLALELAAARVADLGLAAVAAALDDLSGVLVEGDRDLPPRQRSIVAALRWSVDLLPDEAVEVLRALSVFRGGAAREAIDSVLGRPVAADLGTLREASLVSADATGRVTILEPVRQFAATLGETDRFRDTHRAWFADRARRSWDGMASPQQLEWMAELDADTGNLQVAIDGASLEERLEIAGAVGRWLSRGRFALGRAILEPLIDQARAAGLRDARAILVLGTIDRLQGIAAAAQRLEEARDLARATNDHDLEMLATMQCAGVLREGGDAARAIELLEGVLPVAEVSGGRVASQVFHELGVARVSTDPAAGIALLRRAVEGFAAIGDLSSRLGAASDLGFVLRSTGASEEGRAFLEAMLEEAEASQDLSILARIRLNLGVLSFDGDPWGALEHYRGAAVAFEELGDIPRLRTSLRNLLMAQRNLDESAEAARTAERLLGLTNEDVVADLQLAAQAFLEAGQFESASGLTARLLRRAPDEPVHQLFDAWARAGTGDRLGAREIIDRLSLPPGDPVATTILESMRPLLEGA